MVEESGTVIGLIDDGRIALVRCERQRACAGCPSENLCAPGSKQSRHIKALNRAGAVIDDPVRIVTSSRNFLVSSFILYILPVFGLLCGAAIGHFLGVKELTTLDPELMTALVGVAGMAGTFLIIRRATAKLKSEAFMPVITAVTTAKIQESPYVWE